MYVVCFGIAVIPSSNYLLKPPGCNGLRSFPDQVLRPEAGPDVDIRSLQRAHRPRHSGHPRGLRYALKYYYQASLKLNRDESLGPTNRRAADNFRRFSKSAGFCVSFEHNTANSR